MRRKNTFYAIISIIIIVFFPSCSNLKANDIPDSRITDWSNKNLGEETTPGWLYSLVRGDIQNTKKDLDIIDNTSVKYSIGKGSNLHIAREQSELNYYYQVINEIDSFFESNKLSIDNIENSIVLKKEITVTGIERITDFWQKVETNDKKTGDTISEYFYFIVWAIDNDVWDRLILKYINDVD